MEAEVRNRGKMGAFGLVCMYGLTAFDDLKTKQIRAAELIIFGIIGVILELVYRYHSVISIVGGIAIGLAMLAFSIISKEKLGKGDAYVILISGLYLGFVDLLSLLWISFVYATIAGIIIIRKYDNSTSHEIPFIPFLLAGYLTLYGAHTLGGLG